MLDLNIQSSGNNHTIIRPGTTGSQSSNTEQEPNFYIVLKDNQHTLALQTPVAIGDGTGNYVDLLNKPSINGVELVGRLSFEDLGLGDIPMTPLSNEDIDVIMGFAPNEAVLKELFAQGGEVDIANDIVITSPITVAKDTVLNLKRNTLTYNSNGNLFVVNNATLTIKNGTIQSESGIVKVNNGGTLIIQNGIYRSKYIAFTIGTDSRIIVNYGNISATNKCISLIDNGVQIINGGIFNPEL